MRKFLSQLALATRRVANEYRAAAQARGVQDVHVRVDLWGLERPDAHRLWQRVAKNEYIPDPAWLNDPVLEAQKQSYLVAEVVRVSGPVEATSITLDAVRSALYDEKLADQVTNITTGIVDA